MLKITTWNVNSIRARLEGVSSWIRSHKPDVLLLQEIKCETKAFPYSVFEDMGYSCAVFGQKSYNGVAILSRSSVEDVVLGLPEIQDEARYIEALIGGAVRVASVYVPNGQEVDSPAYFAKLSFLEAMRTHLEKLLNFEEVTVVGGDFNIAPSDDDVYDPALWHEQTLCTLRERQAFRSLINLGYKDVLEGSKNEYTWFGYRGGAFQKNQGLRIDHFLLSPWAYDKSHSVHIDLESRALEKASDHAPVTIELG